MNIKAVLFDFDGTFMDTEPAIFAAYSHLFRTYRTIEEFTPEKKVSVLGPSLEVMIGKYFPDHDTAKLVDEYRVYQRTFAMDTIVPMEHAETLAAWLRANGYKIGFVSSRRHDSMMPILEKLQMQDYFDVIVGREDITHEKPHPEGIRHAMELLGTKDVMYVGDSPSDILAGKNAGVTTAAYITNEGKRAAVLETEPDIVLDDLLQLKEYLLKQ